MAGTYETDFALWAAQQARALRDVARAGGNAPVDWENVAEEIETLGRSEKAALRSQIARIIEHLMKLQASPATDPRRGWEDTIVDARRECERTLKDSPSLRRVLAQIVADETTATRKYVRDRLRRYGETPVRDPEELSYSVDQVLGEWWPTA